MATIDLADKAVVVPALESVVLGMLPVVETRFVTGIHSVMETVSVTAIPGYAAIPAALEVLRDRKSVV